MSDGSDLRGPRTGADRAVLLAPGAGADRRAPALVAVAEALADAGVPSMCFDFPYRLAGRRAPDRPPVLLGAVATAAAELAAATGLPPDRLVLGGRSMGGRICSMAVAGEQVDAPQPALGLLLLGYPLHAAGKPENRRDTHFKDLRVPVLFVSGTRDSMAPRAQLTRSSRKVKGDVTLHWLESADHGFRPLKSSGLTTPQVLADVAETSVTWVRALT